MKIQLPELWREWPTSIEVHFHPTLTSSTSSEDFQDFSVTDLTAAARKLFEHETGSPYHPGYRLHTVGIVGAVSVWVAWPLLRKAGLPHVEERDGPRRDAIGLTYGADDTLSYLWKEPSGPLGYSGQLRLATGGRTLADAVAAYDFLAPQLRTLRRAIRSWRTPAI